jgi:hypothetical protein
MVFIPVVLYPEQSERLSVVVKQTVVEKTANKAHALENAARFPLSHN